MVERKSRQDVRLQEMLEAAHMDRHLKLSLIAEPNKVAKEWGVKLGTREVERLTKLGGFVELANEARVGRIWECDPRICYPATIWLRQELVDLIQDLIIVPQDLIRYPGPILKDIEGRLDHRLGLIRTMPREGIKR
jgi:hypothetical protein